MSVTFQSAMTALVQGVQTYFTANEISSVVDYGVRAWWHQDNQGPGGGNRVVFVGSEFHGERDYRPRPAGKLVSKLGHAQTNPAEIAHWIRPVAVAIWAAPNFSDPNSELLQNENTETLLEQTVNAMRSTFRADAFVEAWTLERAAPPQEQAFGESIICNFTLRSVLFYPATDVVTPNPAVGRLHVS